ncbi:M20/M25/M40 family metallo-hydrolase [Sphingomonas sp. AP4-R1]|uniref:M20/M25/M40 family metallo-hydrolase n=1 Tax=Sphingomonas sp. AP4-R1 TaxID=2735134 RepID=UPI001493A2A2|nr:M20/M25/M40 family metallo-hydrolase [Sphingomonas sp. AP4-R1]QJU59596.1 M20/M25/M40 family metallo-hydrolase [Sphingomonas sp. AP4-R1]
MKMITKLSVTAALALALAACGKSDGEKGNASASAESSGPKLGIRPYGDETVKPDMSKIKNADLPKIFDYVDKHIDDHVVNLQKWIQQPSISNTGEGIQESAEMVKGFFDQLGCQTTKVYEPGKTKWGSQANPVVYGKCDEGAKKTLIVYWQYDTMPVTQPDLWKAPPFEGRLVEQAPFKKVLIGRGATNSKGPEMTFLNAVMSIKAVTGKLPVNLIFVAEGDEERMDIGLNKFMTDHQDLFKGADGVWGPGGSEGCVFVELTTSGHDWGRGPDYSDVHGVMKLAVDSPAWRHITMLSKMVSPDGNHVMIPGFYDDLLPPTPEQDAAFHKAAANFDLKQAAKNAGLTRFISDDPYEVLKMLRSGTSMNLDGIWGGNMFAGGSGAILPNKITSKHNFRYQPNMTGDDIVAKLRKYLDQLGYKDVKINVVGDVPWAKRDNNNDLFRANSYSQSVFGLGGGGGPFSGGGGGYWPAYVFAGKGTNIDLPINTARGGAGGNAHAANEWYAIEGSGKQLGMASSEKLIATALYSYAGLNGPVPVAPVAPPAGDKKPTAAPAAAAASGS